MPDPAPPHLNGQANKDLLERFYAAIEQDQLEVIERLFDEQIVVRVAGRHDLSGTFRGRDAAMRLYRRLVDALGPDFRFPPHDVLADEQSIVVLPKAASWRTAERGTDVYHVVEGRISEIWLTEWHLNGWRLGVDAASPTGATRLYEKAGMRVTREFAVYEKELRAGAEPGQDEDA